MLDKQDPKQRLRSPQEQLEPAADQQATPGTRTRSERLPAQAAPVQRKSMLPSLSRPAQAGGALQDWTNAVFRPDLHQAPVAGRGSPVVQAKRDSVIQREAEGANHTAKEGGEDRKEGGEDAKTTDSEHERKVAELVAAGKHLEAVYYIRDTYGFTGYDVEWLVVEELSGAWATTSGELKTGAKQTIKVAKKLFEKNFAFIVRTIGHEFQHVKQRSGKEVLTNQATREFLAWAWEALDESVPKYDLKTAAWHANKALTYWARMPEDLQKEHKDVKDKLDALISKAASEGK